MPLLACSCNCQDCQLIECHFCSVRVRPSDLQVVSHDACGACQSVFVGSLAVPTVNEWDPALEAARQYAPLDVHRAVQSHYVRVSRSHQQQVWELLRERRELWEKVTLMKNEAAAKEAQIAELTAKVAQLRERASWLEDLESERHADERMKRDVIVSTRRALAKLVADMTPYADIV